MRCPVCPARLVHCARVLRNWEGRPDPILLYLSKYHCSKLTAFIVGHAYVLCTYRVKISVIILCV